MKKIIKRIIQVLFFALLINKTNAQNIFPSTGRVGIYTTSPAATMQIKGGARIGTLANYVNIDSATGNLSFKGTAVYQVANNQYAFQNSANPGIGLYFNATNARYEFRNSASSPTFYVGASTGNGVFTGNLKVGAYTLPATDGANGQLLKTNGAGTLTWSPDNTTSYSAGTGISIAGNTITNTAPDQIVTIAPATNMAVVGNYPNYALSFVSSPWFANGNAGTNPATNFIGTTDAQPLVFKVNNIRAAFLDNSGNGNTSFGYQGLIANTSGFGNTVIGSNSLKTNTTGSRNTAVGYYALVTSNADNNTAIGTYALSANTSGTDNVATGVNSLSSNTTGINNSAYGNNALYSNTTGEQNTANGYGALFTNQTGNNNAAFGKYALYNNTANDNTGLGYNAMFFNTTGINNTAIGSVALQNNTTGQQNTATGYAALYSDNGGSYNSAHGTAALNSNVSGSWNTANGAYALYHNTNSYYNTATGGNALYSNTLGTNNTANGYNALYNNTADNNTALGSGALYANTTGAANTATGLEALHFNTTGNNNTANGLDALLSNTTGSNNTATGNASLLSNDGGSYNTSNGYNALSGNSQGSYNTALGANALYKGNVLNNTAIGYAALYSNLSGNDNTAIGYSALYYGKGSQNTAIGSGALQSGYSLGSGNGCTATGYLALKYNYGNYNTANGYEALVNITSGDNNTASGTNAMISLTTGSNNVSMGYAADITGTTNNSIAIGTNMQVISDNIAKIGNSATSFLFGPVYIVASDGRFKKNIKENVPGLDFINLLRPVTYQYKSEELQKHLAGNDSAMLAHVSQLNYKDAESKVHMGFIAQEVEKMMDEKGYKGTIVKKPVSEQDNYGLAYDEFIPPMVKAMQQLSTENDSLKNVNDKQQHQINSIITLLTNLQLQVNDLKQLQQQCCDQTSANKIADENNTSVRLTDDASLWQNVPNPFANTTTITYTLPKKLTNAQIIITDNTGKTLKAVNISGSGKGSLNVDAATFSSGAYNYSLIIDGKLIGSKQMILSK